MATYAQYGIDLHTNRGYGEARTTCPQCSATRKKHKDPCLAVNLDKRTWFCHHCGYTGGLNQNDHAQRSVERRNDLRPVITYQAPEKLPDDVLGFFKQRGIDESVLRRNRIGFGQVFMPQVSKEIEAIQFPYYQGEAVVNIKYRDFDKNFRGVKNAPRILYGLNDIAETTIIVEGEMDKLALEMAGFQNGVSVPDGAPNPRARDACNKLQFLENCKEQLKAVKRFILAVDSDEAGQTLQDELSRRLGREMCAIVSWPEDCKDANDVLLKHGKEALQSAINTAKPYPLKGVLTIDDLYYETLKLYDEGVCPGLSPGWPELEKLYTIKEGQMTIVTGIPGHGKSEVLDAIMVNLAQQHDWAFGIFSPENQPYQRHMIKLVEKYTGKPSRDCYNNRMSKEDLTLACNWLSQYFYYFQPEDNAVNIDNLLDIAKGLVTYKGIKGLVFDPWNEIEHKRPNNLSETEYISSALTKIRQFARDYSVHVWIVAHPTKLPKQSDGHYPAPSPYDISGSANWRNKADNCLAVWRDFKDNPSMVQVHVQKIRFKEIGKTGMCELQYNIETGRYDSPLNAFKTYYQQESL